MTEQTFKHEMSKAKTFQDIEPGKVDYWIGYQRGLRRAFHGANFGTEAEHTLWLSMAADIDISRQQRGKGYQDGLQAI